MTTPSYTLILVPDRNNVAVPGVPTRAWSGWGFLPRGHAPDTMRIEVEIPGGGAAAPPFKTEPPWNLGPLGSL